MNTIKQCTVKLLTILLFSLLCFFPDSIEGAKKPIATLTKFFGEVYVLPTQQQNWNLVRKGLLFYEGDRIKSEEDGKAEIYFSNGSQIILSPDSEMEFNPVDKKQRKKRSIFMRSGRTFNKVTSGTQYEVESIYAVAAVKGTEFYIVQSDSETTALVGEGEVEITNKNTEQSVTGKRDTKTTVTEEILNQVEEKYIGSDKLSSEIFLSTSISGTPRSDELFEFTITIRNKEDKLISDAIDLTIISSSTGLSFLEQTTLKQKIELTVKDGKQTIQVLGLASGKPERYTITTTGKNIESNTLDVTVLPSISEKEVIINFKDNDDKPRLLKMIYKKK